MVVGIKFIFTIVQVKLKMHYSRKRWVQRGGYYIPTSSGIDQCCSSWTEISPGKGNYLTVVRWTSLNFEDTPFRYQFLHFSLKQNGWDVDRILECRALKEYNDTRHIKALIPFKKAGMFEGVFGNFGGLYANSLKKGFRPRWIVDRPLFKLTDSPLEPHRFKVVGTFGLSRLELFQ